MNLFDAIREGIETIVKGGFKFVTDPQVEVKPRRGSYGTYRVVIKLDVHIPGVKKGDTAQTLDTHRLNASNGPHHTDPV